ncbi:MAG: hypothetical protein D6778_07840, partial [Nitrospirae bacterium]
YNLVPSTSELYREAQFYLSLTEAMRSLSLMKVVIDIDGDGQLATDCDVNQNGVPDDVDATGCALLYVANQSCPNNVTYTVGNVTLSGLSYTGLKIRVTGSGQCPNPPSYSDLSGPYYPKLVYIDNTTGTKVLVTTTSETCNDQNGQSWPCPVIENNTPLDMVTAIDNATDEMINALQDALPGVDQDVVNSLNEIKQEACGADGVCTSQDLANYLDNITIQ